MKKKTLTQLINEEVDFSRNIGHIYLDFEAYYGATRKDHERLDDVINAAKQSYKNLKGFARKSMYYVMHSIAQTLQEQSFHYQKKAGTLHQSLRNGKVSCEQFSQLYYSIGEALNLPLHLVIAPRHAFVRWDEDGKHDALNLKNPVNKGDANWETTEGFYKSDQEYIEWLKIPESVVRNGCYLKSLTKKEAVSYAYMRRATRKQVSDDFNEAAEDYAKALHLYRKNPLLYYSRGLSQIMRLKATDGLKDIKDALKLDPESPVSELGKAHTKKEK